MKTSSILKGSNRPASAVANMSSAAACVVSDARSSEQTCATLWWRPRLHRESEGHHVKRDGGRTAILVWKTILFPPRSGRSLGKSVDIDIALATQMTAALTNEEALRKRCETVHLASRV